MVTSSGVGERATEGREEAGGGWPVTQRGASRDAPTRPRAVLLVANEANPYSRALRVARSLAEQGFDVEIAAVSGDAPDVEHDGEIAIRRYRPTGGWARLSSWADRATSAPAIGPKGNSPSRRTGRLERAIRRGPAASLALAVKVAFWPLRVRGWGATLRRELPPADLYHAFGILTIPIALDLAAAARSAGRHGRAVYDVIDVILESNNYDDVARPLLAWYRVRERRWVRRADAIVTVNEPIATHLRSAWRLRTDPVVLLNSQPRWDPPADRPDRIREATGIPPARRIVLFLGRLGRERGLDEAAEAVLSLDDAALVLIGFGVWADRLRQRDTDPRFVGRHFTLPPVHPDELAAWTASADVSIVAVPANSLNQRLSSPNKFWESLTAGTPVVVGRDLVVMREIVEAERVGAVADLAEVEAGLRGVLDQPPADLAAMRERCLAITRTRYNWETAVQPYLRLVTELVPVATGPSATVPAPSPAAAPAADESAP
ncbi:MAG TPA: glycosyltransferase [Candidatus Limnocylindrales bacterium]|nr:glycosyltransferase [Candidatus Limnocylindrales bacterium]